MSLSGKVVAITGGASGIGLATAKLVAERGGVACIADVSSDRLAQAELELAKLTSTYASAVVDVSDRSQVDGWIGGIVRRYGRLDGAANVAGVIGRGHGVKTVAELEDDEWNTIMGVNLTGLMFCLRRELQVISDGGSIVNVSSIHGTRGIANHGAYAASKHGVIGLTKAAAAENGEREIRVNAVAPGAIDTPMMQEWLHANNRPADAPFSEPTAFRRMGTAEEVAKLIVFLLGPDSAFISGSVYSVDGGWK